MKLLPTVIILENYGVLRPVKGRFLEGLVLWVWFDLLFVRQANVKFKALILERSYSTLDIYNFVGTIIVRKSSYSFLFFSFPFDEIMGITVVSTRPRDLGESERIIKKPGLRKGKRGTIQDISTRD